MKITDILDAKLNLGLEHMDLEHEQKCIIEELKQLHREMEEEAEPEGGPIVDMYADEMDAYEGALRIAKGSSDTPLTYDHSTIVDLSFIP